MCVLCYGDPGGVCRVACPRPVFVGPVCSHMLSRGVFAQKPPVPCVTGCADVFPWAPLADLCHLQPGVLAV